MGHIEGAIWPDPMRGLYVLLDGATILDRNIQPQFVLPADVYNQTETVYVHLVKHHVQTSSIDRVTEVRVTVYGRTPTESDDLAEAILVYACGEDIETPETRDAAPYYFDYIEHRDGPIPQSYPGDTVSPSVMTVAVGARPMN